MKKKFIKKVCLFVSLVITAIGMCGCAQKNVASDDDNTLEVYLWNAILLAGNFRINMIS